MSNEQMHAAEKRHAETLGTAAVLAFAERKVNARIYTRRGAREMLEGGTVQRRALTAMVLCAALPEAELIDATTGDTRARTFTYDDLTWQLTPDGVQRSPYGAYWLLRAEQTTR